MTITNIWAIAKMETFAKQGKRSAVVFNVHWTLTGTDGAHTASVYGSVNVPAPGADFTAYVDLTQEQVIGWVKAALGSEQVAAAEANVAKQIADLANPPVITPPLPWA